MHLYFIALLPPPALRNRVRLLKEDMRDRFKAGHALTSPAHVTLQMPFKREAEAAKQLITGLEAFAAREQPFPVTLSGFGCFAPRVLYINIPDHRHIVDLHTRLKKEMVDNLGFRPEETDARFHPHMTIATRDLTPDNFHKAWAELQKRTFEASFEVHSLFLLKHTGQQWQVEKELYFEAK